MFVCYVLSFVECSLMYFKLGFKIFICPFTMLYPFLPFDRNLNNALQVFFFFIFLFLMENTFTASKACFCMISYKCREVSEKPFRINNTETILVNEKV